MDHSADYVPLDRLLAHREWVRRVASALVQDENDADDLAQDLWLEALQRPPRIGRSIRGWLVTALRHDVADSRRSESCRARREESQARAEAIPSAEELVAKADADKRVVVAVMDLDEPYRSTILYRFFEDLPPSIIAGRQGIPVGTVKTRLKRALAQLRERFDAESGGDREKWCLALLPLLRRSLNTSAARGTAAAAAGAIIMGVKAKVVAALVTLVLIAVGLWSSRSEQRPLARVPIDTKSPTVDQTPPPARPVSPQPVPTKYGIDGTTHVGGDPAIATVGAWPLGIDPAPDSIIGPPTLGRPWLEVPEPSPPTAQTRSDAIGAFALDGLRRGSWVVVGTFDGGRRAAQTVTLTQDAPRARVVLAAPAGGYRIHGRAIHGDGTPFVGWIGLWRNDAPGDSCVWITSEATGAFEFAGLPLGNVTVYALRAGSPLANAWVRLPCEKEVVLVVDAHGATRHGRVVEAKDGAPVAGATVVTGTRGHRMGTGVQTRTTTGPDGRFDFVTPNGKASLEVRAEGFITVRGYDDGSGDELIVRLERRALLTGRVVRADDGTAVAGAVVCAETGGIPFTGRTQAMSGPGGEFRLETCAVGRVDVYVLGGGWASERLADADKRGFDPFAHEIAAGSSSEVVLRAVPAARVEGRVIDAKDAPVTAVTVEAHRSVAVGRAPLGTTPAATTTSADGAFGFADLVPGSEWSFRARPPVGEPKLTEAMRLASGSTTNVDIRLDALRLGAVTVLADDTGAPIANALVSVATASHGPWDTWTGSFSSWTTDANGAVDVGPVGPTCASVYAKAPGFVESHVAPEAVDATMLRAVVRLVRAKPLVGRVVLPDGVPFEAATAVLAENQARKHVNADLDEEGRFRFDTLAEETWTILASAEWGGRRYEAETTAHPGDSDVVLKLVEKSKLPTMEVRVTDARGDPLAAGTVSWSLSSGAVYFRGEADVSAGVAAVARPDGPASGSLEIRPKPPGSAGSGALRVELLDPLPRSLDVRLPPEQRISGRVTGPSGEAVPTVRVIAQPAGLGVSSFRDESQAHGAALTGEYGTFEIGGLGALAYRLTCVAPPGLVLRRPVEAVAGASGVEIRLSVATLASVTVRGPDGAPLAGCAVSVWSGRDHVGTTLTSQTGRAEFPDLDPEVAYALRVDPPTFREDLVTTTLGGWKPHDVAVQLGGAGTIAGIVRDDKGRAIPWAGVLCISGSRAWTTPAGADGRFRVVGVQTDDAVRLRVQLDGEQDMASAMPKPPATDVTTKAGDNDVVLVAGTSDLVSVRVEGAPESVATTWRIGTVVRAGDEREREGFVRGDGVLRFRGLDPSLRHRLFVGPTGDGRFGLTDNLVVGPPEVTLRLVAGVPLSGQMALPTGVRPQDVIVTARGDLWTARTSVDTQGRFRFPGLPQESCAISVIALREGKLQFAGNADATPGADVMIELKLVSDGGR